MLVMLFIEATKITSIITLRKKFKKNTPTETLSS